MYKSEKNAAALKGDLSRTYGSITDRLPMEAICYGGYQAHGPNRPNCALTKLELNALYSPDSELSIGKRDRGLRGQYTEGEAFLQI